MSEHKRGKKLAYFLKRMDEPGLNGLEEYLRSPLFANSPQMAELLRASLQCMSEDNLDQEKIHAALFPDKKWDVRRGKYLQLRLVHLLNHLMDFHALQQYQADEQGRYLYRLGAAIEHDWESYIAFSYTQALRNLPEGAGSARLMATLQIETRYNSYLSGIAANATDTHLEQVHHALDHYFFLQKLKYATASANLHLGSNEFQIDPVLDFVIRQVDELKDDDSNVLLRAYSLALRLISQAVSGSAGEGDEAFVRFKEFFARDIPAAKAEKMDLFTYALNFCTVRIHQGRAEYIAETKWLYDRMLGGGLLLEGGQLGAAYYKNIVTIMCRYRELDWAENFVEEYRDKIAADPGQLTYLYNKAVLAFHRGDYAATVRILYHRIQEFADIQMGIAARNYLCRALWEQQEYQWLSSNLSAFRVYLKRQKTISETDRRIHLLYVKYFEQIVNAHTMNPDRSRQKLETIKNRLESSGVGAVFQSLIAILNDLIP